jgi:hypothetical protein
MGSNFNSIDYQNVNIQDIENSLNTTLIHNINEKTKITENNVYFYKCTTIFLFITTVILSLTIIILILKAK